MYRKPVFLSLDGRKPTSDLRGFVAYLATGSMPLKNEILLSFCPVMIRCNDKQFNVCNRLRVIFQIAIFSPKQNTSSTGNPFKVRGFLLLLDA
jgi:hypothetical protein